MFFHKILVKKGALTSYLSRTFLVDKIGASYMILETQTVGHLWCMKNSKRINNMEEYNWLTGEKIGGALALDML